jgi:hypothetical protein
MHVIDTIIINGDDEARIMVIRIGRWCWCTFSLISSLIDIVIEIVFLWFMYWYMSLSVGCEPSKLELVSDSDVDWRRRMERFGGSQKVQQFACTCYFKALRHQWSLSSFESKV